jgi:hypothetical protein
MYEGCSSSFEYCDLVIDGLRVYIPTTTPYDDPPDEENEDNYRGKYTSIVYLDYLIIFDGHRDILSTFYSRFGERIDIGDRYLSNELFGGRFATSFSQGNRYSLFSFARRE